MNPFDVNNFTILHVALANFAGDVTQNQAAPVNCRCELIQLALTLTTDATVANRVPRLSFVSSGGTSPICVSNVSVAASSVFNFMFGINSDTAGNTDVDRYNIVIPGGIFVLEGDLHQIAIENGVAGDGVTLVKALYRIWPFDQ